jgi:hypothetical protein
MDNDECGNALPRTGMGAAKVMNLMNFRNYGEGESLPLCTTGEIGHQSAGPGSQRG